MKALALSSLRNTVTRPVRGRRSCEGAELLVEVGPALLEAPRSCTSSGPSTAPASYRFVEVPAQLDRGEFTRPSCDIRAYLPVRLVDDSMRYTKQRAENMNVKAVADDEVSRRQQAHATCKPLLSQLSIIMFAPRVRIRARRQA